jgi:hypothetical protein
LKKKEGQKEERERKGNRENTGNLEVLLPLPPQAMAELDSTPSTVKLLCEAYLRIDPEFDLWNYFFRVQRPHDPETELMVSRGAVIHVKSGHGVNP